MQGHPWRPLSGKDARDTIRGFHDISRNLAVHASRAAIYVGVPERPPDLRAVVTRAACGPVPPPGAARARGRSSEDAPPLGLRRRLPRVAALPHASVDRRPKQGRRLAARGERVTRRPALSGRGAEVDEPLPRSGGYYGFLAQVLLSGAVGDGGVSRGTAGKDGRRGCGMLAR